MVLFLKGICMPRGRKTSLTICLTPAQRQALRALQRALNIPADLARPARIVFLLADGATFPQIAATVGIGRRFVYKWVKRFWQEGLGGLKDNQAPGRRFEPLPPYLRDQPHNLDVG